MKKSELRIIIKEELLALDEGKSVNDRTKKSIKALKESKKAIKNYEDSSVNAIEWTIDQSTENWENAEEPAGD